LTLNNIAVRLDKSLDTLTEAELAGLFGEPRTEDLKRWYSGDSSCFPKLAFETAQLNRLPPDYLSANLCILDFDQAFLSEHPPKELAHIPVRFMAPESIFTLTNSPAADVWALGSILFNLRDPSYLFFGLAASDPEGAVSLMHEVLGDLPSEWRTFPFLDGYPVHEPLQPDVEYDTFEGLDELAAASGPITLEQLIDEIVEPRRPVTETANPNVGAAKFCLEVPKFAYKDQHKEQKFLADNSTPITQEDAALFTNLLRRIFTWDYQGRITAKEILEHPWLREPGQTLRPPEPEQGVESSPQESDQPKTSTRIVPVQLPARTADTVETKTMDTEASEVSSLDKGVEQETGTEGTPQRDTGN
jgi:serine/threonine protein kinase